MKITLLGTGTSQGVPVIGCDCKVCQSDNPKDNRLRTSALVSWGSYKFVIDCGPDFRMQMLRQNVKSIDGILFTHEYADHTAGLDDIRPIYFRNNKSLPIYGLKRVMDELAIRFCDIEVPVPDIKIQEAIVTIYHTLETRKKINQQLKDSIKPLCPILMRGVVKEMEI